MSKKSTTLQTYPFWFYYPFLNCILIPHPLKTGAVLLPTQAQTLIRPRRQHGTHLPYIYMAWHNTQYHIPHYSNQLLYSDCCATVTLFCCL